MAYFYTAHHCKLYAIKPVKEFVWGFKENQDGWDAQQVEKKNLSKNFEFKAFRT